VAAAEAGLVRREADQADGRRALLVRTERGKTLSEELHRFRRSIFATVMSGERTGGAMVTLPLGHGPEREVHWRSLLSRM
jgi:hypothetical protein